MAFSAVRRDSSWGSGCLGELSDIVASQKRENLAFIDRIALKAGLHVSGFVPGNACIDNFNYYPRYEQDARAREFNSESHSGVILSEGKRRSSPRDQ